MIDAQTLTQNLQDLGIREGDAVLTHSSFKAVGGAKVQGGPAVVIQAILDAVGPEGTALFPTHTWHGAGPETPPTFDVRTSPSLVIGVIPETARQWPGAVRSLHPTHSVVAIGARALELTEGHFDVLDQCGPGSPYAKLAVAGGKILLLGVDHNRNTSLHGVEEALAIPGAMSEGYGEAVVFDQQGNRHFKRMRFHSGRYRELNHIQPFLMAEGAQHTGQVGEAQAILIDAQAQWRIAAECLTRDPDLLWQAESDPEPLSP